MGRKPKENLNAEVVKVVKNFDRPVTTEDVAKRLKISWNTAQKYLLKAAKGKKIKHFTKKGKISQHWWMQ